MLLFRAALVVALLVAGSFVNSALFEDVYVPRTPVANGPEIVDNWEWRSMATGQHSWWLAHYVPGAIVTNVNYLSPANSPEREELGIDFSSWRDKYLDIAIDDSAAPLDVSDLGIHDDLLDSGKVFSRIDCRTPKMTVPDSCFFFIAWEDSLLVSNIPIFVAVLTNVDEESEFALVERNLLKNLLGIPLGDVSTISEPGQQP